MGILLFIFVVPLLLLSWKETLKTVVSIWVCCAIALLAFVYLTPTSPLLGIVIPIVIFVLWIRHTFFHQPRE